MKKKNMFIEKQYIITKTISRDVICFLKNLNMYALDHKTSDIKSRVSKRV